MVIIFKFSRTKHLKLGLITLIFCCGFLFSLFFGFSTNLIIQNKNQSFTVKPANNNSKNNNWQTFHGNNNRTGECKTILRENDGFFWNHTVGQTTFRSSPIVYNGLVYTEGWSYVMCCLNASTGESIWNYSAKSDIESTPTIANGLIYFGSDDHNLYCLNASNGLFVWNYTTDFALTSSPAVWNGFIYFDSNDNHIYCLNSTSGILSWRNNITVFNSLLQIYTFSSPTVSNGFLYIGSENGNFYCFNAFTGNILWNYTMGGPIDSSPALANGFLYVGCNDNSTYCLNASSGTLVWKYRTNGEVFSSPSLANGLVYFGSRDLNIYCLNATKGNLMWNYSTQYWNHSFKGFLMSSSGVLSSPGVANGFLYVGSDDGYFYCLNATTGTLSWKYQLMEIYVSPAIANGMVYIVSDVSLLCFPMIITPKSQSHSIGGISIGELLPFSLIGIVIVVFSSKKRLRSNIIQKNSL